MPYSESSRDLGRSWFGSQGCTERAEKIMNELLSQTFTALEPDGYYTNTIPHLPENTDQTVKSTRSDKPPKTDDSKRLPEFEVRFAIPHELLTDYQGGFGWYDRKPDGSVDFTSFSTLPDRVIRTEPSHASTSD